MNKQRLIQRLQKEEELVLKPYLCPAGKLTIGYGRNLEANGISRSEANMLLANDIHNSIFQCEKNILYFKELSDNVQEVLVDMCFNMGIGGLLGFKNMLTAIAKGDFEEAKRELLNSNYAKQLPGRSKRNAELLKT